MIDFKKELQKYNFMDIDEDFSQLQSETAVIFKAFNSTLKRIGIEQNKANTQLEEVIELVGEENEKNIVINTINEKLSANDDEKLLLVNGFIRILDQIENLYRFSVKSSNDNWSQQLEIIWSNISNELLSMGVMQIDVDKILYNKNLYIVKDVKYNPDVADGILLEVLRCGYIYQSKVLRKAEVVVNKKVNKEVFIDE